MIHKSTLSQAIIFSISFQISFGVFAQTVNSGAGVAPVTLPSGVSIPVDATSLNSVIQQLPQGTSLPKNLQNQSVTNAPKNTDTTTEAKLTQDVQPGSGQGIDGFKPNAFQNFIKLTTGQNISIFGQTLFNNKNPFAALESVPVPSAYTLSPGDEVNIKIYSSAIDIDQRFIINRDGTIALPKIGPVTLAGVRMQDVENTLKRQLSKLISDFNVHVSVGQLKGIEVYVVGQTRRPGKLIVSSVSTMINALFASGGPTSNGSMRNIELIRSGNVVGTVDLYDFLVKGDTSKDLGLRSGDVINIPVVGEQIALMGAIPTPAIFEIHPSKKETLGSLIQYAGKLPVFTTPLQASIERVNADKDKPLSALNVNLAQGGLENILKDGDIVTFFPVKPAFDNAVSIRVLGTPSTRVAIQAGGTIKDIFPTLESVLTSTYFLRRFDPVDSASGTSDDFERIRNNNRLDQINWQHATIERINKVDLQPVLIPFNLGLAINPKNPSDEIKLLPGDVITIFSQKDITAPKDQQTRIVRVQGEVNAPGIYQVKPGDALHDLVNRAGGLSRNAYLYGTRLSRLEVREQQKKNIESVIRRLEDQVESVDLNGANAATPQDFAIATRLSAMNKANIASKIKSLRTMTPSGRIALEMSPDRPQLPDLSLEDGDEIYIPPVPSSVSVVGAVYNENSIIYRKNRKVIDYAELAGLSLTAEKQWIFVVRADGTIVAPDSDAWLFNNSVSNLEVMPGDTIVVPEKLQRETKYSVFMRGLKDWTQVMGQLGLAAAAIKVLKD